MSRKDPQIGLRIPAELKDWITEKAKQNRRSVTAELVLMIEKEKALNTANVQSLILTPTS